MGEAQGVNGINHFQIQGSHGSQLNHSVNRQIITNIENRVSKGDKREFTLSEFLPKENGNYLAFSILALKNDLRSLADRHSLKFTPTSKLLINHDLMKNYPFTNKQEQRVFERILQILPDNKGVINEVNISELNGFESSLLSSAINILLKDSILIPDYQINTKNQFDNQDYKYLQVLTLISKQPNKRINFVTLKNTLGGTEEELILALQELLKSKKIRIQEPNGNGPTYFSLN
ncbi:MAG: hypothetical protein HRT47_10675 [Candidatus Caenarcaniphilales bacterium]|nr:hypothetical protein [Candidatus Caenarcaniphilales bacterium]